MIEIISGIKGKGKTKYILEKANELVKNTDGSIIYIDKNNKHSFELNNQIRLINMTEYPVSNDDAFIGFICGIASQNHDIDTILLDSFLTVSKITEENVEVVLKELDILSAMFSINFVLSISMDEQNLPEQYKKNVIVSL